MTLERTEQRHPYTASVPCLAHNNSHFHHPPVEIVGKNLIKHGAVECTGSPPYSSPAAVPEVEKKLSRS